MEEEDEFTQWLDEQSKERIQIAYNRAEKRDTEWWDTESFEAVLMQEVYYMHIGDIVGKLAKEGKVDVTVHEDGLLGYTAKKDKD